jgi:hypothetical protein
MRMAAYTENKLVLQLLYRKCLVGNLTPVWSLNSAPSFCKRLAGDEGDKVAKSLILRMAKKFFLQKCRSNNYHHHLCFVMLQAGSSQLEGGGWREVAIPVTSLGEGYS